MNKMSLLTSICVLLVFSALAQKVNTDSLSLVVKISADQLKLGKLQNTVGQKTNNKRGSAAKAQTAADDNSSAADKLSDDPQNKKLAKNAKNKAGDAKSDARKARKEGAKLDDVDKEIADLKVKIANEQIKLSRFNRSAATTPTMVPMPMQADTTQH